MCFTMGMSAILGTCCFAWAAFEYKNFKCLQYSLGIGYWGLMEWLQAVQHAYAAEKDDNYAMCGNIVNQRLTDVGVAHIIFQPLFCSMTLMSLYRRHDITARIEADLVFRLCVFAGFWYVSYAWTCAAMGWDQTLIPKATPECPNYQWLHEGYDGFSGLTTPNIEGNPCTYYADTRTGHLSWAVPTYRQSYFVPGNSLHYFLMFVPYWVMFHRQFVQLAAICLCLSGPVMASYITPSVNEQAAVWCLYSVIQALLFGIVVRYKELYKQPIPEKIHHAGSYGEQPLTYYYSQNNDPVEKEMLLRSSSSGELTAAEESKEV